MTINLKLGAAALILAASSTCAMAQATGTENNATSGSAPSSSEQQLKTGSDNKDGKSAGSTQTKGDAPSSAGSTNDPAKDLRGHSETPTTGAAK